LEKLEKFEIEIMIDENLIEIFSNLDESSLINASLTCKR
jgi:hypothetical protein